MPYRRLARYIRRNKPHRSFSGAYKRWWGKRFGRRPRGRRRNARRRAPYKRSINFAKSLRGSRKAKVNPMRNKPTYQVVPRAMSTDIAKIPFQYRENFPFASGNTILKEHFDLTSASDPYQPGGGDICKRFLDYMGTSSGKYQKYAVVLVSYQVKLVLASRDNTAAVNTGPATRFFQHVSQLTEGRTVQTALDDDPAVIKVDRFLDSNDGNFNPLVMWGQAKPGAWVKKRWHDRLIPWNDVLHPFDRTRLYLSIGRYSSPVATLQACTVEVTVNFTVMATDRVLQVT